MPKANDENKPLTKREMLGSILAAAIGIQSNSNRERDFQRGSARRYILWGMAGTLLFVLAVYGAVRLILAFSGAA